MALKVVCPLLLVALFISAEFNVRVRSAAFNGKIVRPPPPKYGSVPKLRTTPTSSFDSWTENSENHLWETSGYMEGDIILYGGEDRNGILNRTLFWPDAVVPFYIDEEDFSLDEMKIILNAIGEYHEKTCIKFRSYAKSDPHWIHIKGDKNGCWSSVGMHREGQVVNLHTPKCVQHGVVIHELLHALGFFHQQSATDRDEYVKIHWEHISEGHESNFYKYNDTVITSYGVGYDYGSVMHYSSKAFSKDGNITIEALQPNVTLGQRKGLSEKDITKLNTMYKKSCNKNESYEDSYEELFKDLINLFG